MIIGLHSYWYVSWAPGDDDQLPTVSWELTPDVQETLQKAQQRPREGKAVYGSLWMFLDVYGQ